MRSSKGKTGKAIAAEHVSTKMEKQMNLLILEPAGNHETWKVLSPLSHTD